MLKTNHHMIPINFAGNEIHLLASGACYLPYHHTLIVADLHFEKGSYLALRGQPIPITDTRHTLERLEQEIINYHPQTVICLGDNVHDATGFIRMNEEDLLLLHSLRNKVTHWLWIIGNHDPDQLNKFALGKMQFVSEVMINNLCFTHEFQNNKPLQIIGHYHPKISIIKQGVRITGKCFSVSENTLIMPAFGSYTGGLDISNKVFRDILFGKLKYYLLFKNNIFLVK